MLHGGRNKLEINLLLLLSVFLYILVYTRFAQVMSILTSAFDQASIVSRPNTSD